MQTILGSGGSVGIELAKILPRYTKHIRLFSRHPHKVNDADEILPGDLTNKKHVMEAVEGSDIVYLTAGLKYDIHVWCTNWPVIMQHVIDSCKAHKSKLVFFDNVYMYDCGHIPHMTEETPINPCSRKGMVRAELVQMIKDSVEKGDIQALIARSADFYGPGNKNSVIMETVFKRLKQGKKAMILASAKYQHSHTYTPDAGLATAILGNTSTAYNQTWHLPTRKDAPTGKGWVELFAKEMNVSPKYITVPKFMVQFTGIFDPVMREIAEMMYQNNQNYFFDSSKFDKSFEFKTTSYEDGVKEVVQYG